MSLERGIFLARAVTILAVRSPRTKALSWSTFCISVAPGTPSVSERKYFLVLVGLKISVPCCYRGLVYICNGK